MSPFSVLGLPDTFDVDIAALEKTHRNLSRALHPDRYAQAPAGERRAALDRAVVANEAFRTVRDPLSRAEALFALRGVAVGDGKEPKPDVEFLMDVLEKREALSNAKESKDATAVKKLMDEARREMARVTDGLTNGFALPDERLGEALGLLGELRFFRRFLEEGSSVEDELEHAP